MIYQQYQPPLQEEVFLKREKRFLVHVKDNLGMHSIVHCANSGSMRSCIVPNGKAFTLDSQNPNRKLQKSLELLELEDGLACLNTARANALVELFLRSNAANIDGQELFLKDFPSLDALRREATFNAHTRFDFGFQGGWIEVKSVSLRMDANTIAFPDAVSTRGQKHLRELIAAKQNGEQAFLFFVVMRGTDIPAPTLANQFRPASEIDPAYSNLLSSAQSAGVIIRILVSEITTRGIGIRGYFSYPP